MYLIVGLGNPGKVYDKTRHNVGFDTIDLLAERLGIRVNKIKFKSLYGEGIINGQKVILLKPQTFMNNSGIAVREAKDFFKVDIENILLIVDDIDIDFASIKIKKKGSSGSHNGLKSVIYQLQDDKFPRIKIGIGKKHPNQDLADFVLGRFSSEHRKSIDETILYAAEAVEMAIEDDIDKAMNKFNNKGNKAQV